MEEIFFLMAFFLQNHLVFYSYSSQDYVCERLEGNITFKVYIAHVLCRVCCTPLYCAFSVWYIHFTATLLKVCMLLHQIGVLSHT